MSIPKVTHKTTLFDGVPPKPAPIFTSIKPVIAHERKPQSAAIPVDKHYQVESGENRIIKLLQDIKKSNAQSITVEKSALVSSFTLEEINFLQTHCGGLGIGIEVVDEDDTSPRGQSEADPDVFVPKTPPIKSAPLYGGDEPIAPLKSAPLYGEEEPFAPSPPRIADMVEHVKTWVMELKPESLDLRDLQINASDLPKQKLEELESFCKSQGTILLY